MKIFFMLYIYFSLFFIFKSNSKFTNPSNIKSFNNKLIVTKNINKKFLSLSYNNKIKTKRILEEEINENGKNITKDNDTNTINNKKRKSKNSGIGWLRTTIIIILYTFYVLYVGFRYYRRKKYQNPSFYYKITEEMFADITSIE